MIENIFRVRKFASVFAAIGLFASNLAFAAGQVGAFRPNTIYVAAAENYHFRIYGLPSNPPCPNPIGNFAYINQSDSGSKDQIAAVMLAVAMGRMVNMTVEADGNGYCHVLEVWLP